MGIPKRIISLNSKGGEKMSKKNNNKQFKNKHDIPKTNEEFAGENGLEKIALRAQEKSK